MKLVEFHVTNLSTKPVVAINPDTVARLIEFDGASLIHFVDGSFLQVTEPYATVKAALLA